jgi:membrane-associated phospholipid phosphatase
MKLRVALALVVAASCAGAVAGIYDLAFATDAGRRADARIFHRLGRGDDSKLRRLGRRVGQHELNVVAAAGVVTAGALLAVMSLVGKTRLAGFVIGILVGAAFATTELIKPRFAEWGRDIAPFRIARDTFPSGHATLAMAIVLAAVMSVPARRRVAAMITGAVLATVLGLLIVVGGLHPPSDVVGGYLVAAGWAALLTPYVRPARSAQEVERHYTLAEGLGAGAVAFIGLGFAAVVAVYVENVFGIHQTLIFLVSAFALTSSVIVVVIRTLADLGERANSGR